MAQDDFSEFSTVMKNESVPGSAYLLPGQKKLDYFARVQMLRTVHKFSNEAAKIIALNYTIESLSQDQEKPASIFDVIMKHRIE